MIPSSSCQQRLSPNKVMFRGSGTCTYLLQVGPIPPVLLAPSLQFLPLTHTERGCSLNVSGTFCSAWHVPPSEPCGLLTSSDLCFPVTFSMNSPLNIMLHNAVPLPMSRQGLPPFFPAQTVFRAEFLSPGHILHMYSLSISLMRSSAP